MKTIYHIQQMGKAKLNHGDLLVQGRDEFNSDVTLARVVGGNGNRQAKRLHYVILHDVVSVINWSHRHPVLEYNPRPATKPDCAEMLASCGAI